MIMYCVYMNVCERCVYIIHTYTDAHSIHISYIYSVCVCVYTYDTLMIYWWTFEASRSISMAKHGETSWLTTFPGRGRGEI